MLRDKKLETMVLKVLEKSIDDRRNEALFS